MYDILLAVASIDLFDPFLLENQQGTPSDLCYVLLLRLQFSYLFFHASFSC